MCGSVGFCVRLVTAPVGQDSWLKGGAAGVGWGGLAGQGLRLRKGQVGLWKKEIKATPV